MKINPKDYEKFLSVSEDADADMDEIFEEEKREELKHNVKEKRADMRIYGKTDPKRRYKH